MRKLDIDEGRVLALYEEHETARAVAEIIGCSAGTVYGVLRKHGVPRTHRHPKEHKVIRISGCGRKYCWALISMLRTMCGMSYTEIVAFTGYHPSAVNQVIIKRCPDTKVVLTHKEDVDLEQIAHEYRDLGMTSYELGPKYGVNPATIRKWMRSIGVCIGKKNAPTRGCSGGGKGAAILKERCKQRVIDKLADEGGKLELVEYGEKLTLHCKACGHVFQKSKQGYEHVFTCPHCHEEDLRRHKAEAKARKKFERQQQLEAAREWRLSVPRICKECGQPFYSEYEGAAYCSDTCKRRANNRRNDERKRRKGSANNYRHRMRIKRTPATYDRTVTLAAVYKKYHGRCCQCGRKTCRTKDYAPNQATLDHIVALANNGTHTWDNVQLLCSDCNSMKRDVGQMRLPLAV